MNALTYTLLLSSLLGLTNAVAVDRRQDPAPDRVQAFASELEASKLGGQYSKPTQGGCKPDFPSPVANQFHQIKTIWSVILTYTLNLNCNSNILKKESIDSKAFFSCCDTIRPNQERSARAQSYVQWILVAIQESLIQKPS